MHRRHLILGGIAATAITSLRPVLAQEDFGSTVLRVEADMGARRAAGQVITVDWLLGALGQMDPRPKRIATFELVRRIPYKLSSWTGDPESLSTQVGATAGTRRPPNAASWGD